jgi:hypothetical protein
VTTRKILSASIGSREVFAVKEPLAACERGGCLFTLAQEQRLEPMAREPLLIVDVAPDDVREAGIALLGGAAIDALAHRAAVDPLARGRYVAEVLEPAARRAAALAPSVGAG